VGVAVGVGVGVASAEHGAVAIKSKKTPMSQ
jgi:hypothetical protein